MNRLEENTNLAGIVLLDKPAGMTSNRALRKVQAIFGAKKAGHTGSLDPIATGVLPLCFGKATKYASVLLGAHKTYVVKVLLGVSTSTGDIEGKVLQTCPVTDKTLASMPLVVATFQGVIQQIPPMYSALKHQGQPLYKLARKGIEVDRPPRQVTLFENSITATGNNWVTLRVKCSKGTYMRSLAADLGRRLGCGGCVSELRRVAAGPFNESDLVCMETLTAARYDQTTLNRHLIPLAQIQQSGLTGG